ncbi:hypothetical protein ES706_05751 [subsurface metagenome]
MRSVKRSVKTKVKVFGRSIPVLAIVAIVASAGLVSAALLSYYGKITMTADVKQSVLVDGEDYTWELTDVISEAAPGGETFCFKHTLKNQASVPATVMLVTDITAVYDNGDPMDSEGVTTTYLTAPVQLKATGDGTAEWTTEMANSGDYSVKLTVPSLTDRAGISIPTDIALKDITDLSFWKKVTSFGTKGRDPCVVLAIDANNDGTFEGDIFAFLDADKPDMKAAAAEYLGSDAIILIGTKFTLTGMDSSFSEFDALLSGYGVHSVDTDMGLTTEDSLSPWLNTACGAIDPTDSVLAVMIEIGGQNRDNETVYIDDITINDDTYDLEIIPEDTPITLQPGETLDFYICYSFAIDIMPGTYTITTTVVPE